MTVKCRRNKNKPRHRSDVFIRTLFVRVCVSLLLISLSLLFLFSYAYVCLFCRNKSGSGILNFLLCLLFNILLRNMGKKINKRLKWSKKEEINYFNIKSNEQIQTELFLCALLLFSEKNSYLTWLFFKYFLTHSLISFLSVFLIILGIHLREQIKKQSFRWEIFCAFFSIINIPICFYLYIFYFLLWLLLL